MEDKIVKIINEMAEYLNVAQMKKLQEVLLQTFSESEAQKEQISNEEYLKLFLDAKKIEGCSERTIQYYRVTVERLLQTVDTPLRKMTTEEIRRYLVEYQKINNCGKVTIDNVRRNISSFFSWLEEEDYILKSPMRRIHKIKTKQPVKETISDEAIERLRELGRELNLDKIHPHKFRRTMATRAIDKAMPIEQVQKILGHSQIGTTMQYAIVNQNNVKTSHQKFIA